MQRTSVVACLPEDQLREVFQSTYAFDPMVTVSLSSASTAVELVADCRAVTADVVVVDLRARHVNPQKQASLVVAYPLAKPIAVVDEGSVSGIGLALAAGARGIIADDASSYDIQRAVSEVTAGHTFLTRGVLTDLSRDLRRKGANRPSRTTRVLAELTDRERDVVECLSRGMRNRDIAKELKVSEAAVKANLSRLMVKWGVTDRLQILVAALKSGLIIMQDHGDE